MLPGLPRRGDHARSAGPSCPSGDWRHPPAYRPLRLLPALLARAAAIVSAMGGGRILVRWPVPGV